ncbi:MAG: prenyltransferase/squalene oxidase repeat-containing protein [Thermoplasmata archaeon]
MNPAGRSSAPKKRTRTQSLALAWLLEANQPSMRYRTLTELLGRKESDPDVRKARKEILERGWAAEILSRRRPGGGWSDGETQYRPKYLSTNWMMLVLADLGLTRGVPEVEEACEFWMDGFTAKGDVLGSSSKGNPHYCIAANLARALIRLGYADDARVQNTLDWLVRAADPKGGWSCFGSGRNLDSWEAMSAFAAYPRSKWTKKMEACVERGAEFFLARELHLQGDRYEPWYRFHYPPHYYYDLLVGLDFMTGLGYAADPRMGYAVDYLRSRQRPDGTWTLDAVHPDLEGAAARWYATHPKHRPTPFALEKVGRPSKMITLTALRVLDAVDRAVPSGSRRP